MRQHRTHTSLIGVPSGEFPHLWQLLRSEPSPLIFLGLPVWRPPAGLLWLGLLLAKSRDCTFYRNWVETGWPHWSTLPVWLHFILLKDKTWDFFVCVLFFFIKNLLRWCNYRLFFKNYLQLTGPEKRHFFFFVFFSFCYIHLIQSLINPTPHKQPEIRN